MHAEPHVPLWKRPLLGLAVICMQNSGEIGPRFSSWRKQRDNLIESAY